MIAEAYLGATRTRYQVITDEENRFPKYVTAVRSMLGDLDLEVVFVRSNMAKSEIVLGSKPLVIVDRQVELYFTALAFPEVFWSDEPNFDEQLWRAYCYVAAAELSLGGDSRRSSQILAQTGDGTNFNLPESILSELARLHFTIFHEDGHNKLAQDQALREQIFEIVDMVFFELFGEMSHFDPQMKVWTDEIKEECAVDYLSLIQMIGLLKEDQLAEISSGGLSVFTLQSLICIHRIAAIKRLKGVLEAVRAGTEFARPPVDPIALRLRVTRQIFNKMNSQYIGKEQARDVHDQFTAYLERNHKSLSQVFPERLHQKISSLPCTKREEECDPFGGPFTWI